MKIQNIKNIERFFEVIDQCQGKVMLVTKEGDHLNLKSKLTQFVAFANVFANTEIGELELIASEKEDVDRLFNYLIHAAE